ncbi:hypothetical protein V6N12_048159 [Hibiscus sabdariffa]|uniref:Uncharacterized protein n=1 Tax=Hibiscus sabdariffa TaxID=183260 RepID=A0ABR2EGF5_9ROSI
MLFCEVPLPKTKAFMPTFPAQHAQDRRMRRVLKSPDPLQEQRKKEWQQGELGDWWFVWLSEKTVGVEWGGHSLPFIDEEIDNNHCTSKSQSKQVEEVEVTSYLHILDLV